MYKIYHKHNNTTTVYTVTSINILKEMLDEHPYDNFTIYECEEITKADVIRKYYQQNSCDKYESCLSCWKEGEHDKEYNNTINTSASTENL